MREFGCTFFWWKGRIKRLGIERIHQTLETKAERRQLPKCIQVPKCMKLPKCILVPKYMMLPKCIQLPKLKFPKCIFSLMHTGAQVFDVA